MDKELGDQVYVFVFSRISFFQLLTNKQTGEWKCEEEESSQTIDWTRGRRWILW